MSTTTATGTRSTAPVRLVTASAPAAPTYRLTRRGRVVVVMVSLLAIALLALAFGPAVVATDEAGAPADTLTVRVTGGATLWDIAAEANPTGDIRDTVDDIVRLNALSSASDVVPGAELAVPVY